MSTLVFKNSLNISRRFFLSVLPHCFKYHMVGIVPGGGLGKLQGIKEEEYFTRKDSELVKKMKQKVIIDKYGSVDYENALSQNPDIRTGECACSLKHKNPLEEAYFLSEHCDCLQVLKTKLKDEE